MTNKGEIPEIVFGAINIACDLLVRGWCQEHYARDKQEGRHWNDKRATAWDAVGALHRGLREHTGIKIQYGDADPDNRAIIEPLHKMVIDAYTELANTSPGFPKAYPSITEWNDQKGMKREYVIASFELARTKASEWCFEKPTKKRTTVKKRPAVDVKGEVNVTT